MQNVRYYVIVILILVTVDVFSKDYKIGDSLKDVVKTVQNSDLFSTEDLGLWPENKVSIYKISDGNLVLFSMNYYPFGIITKASGNNIFLIDYNGDSILDCQPEMLFVPP